MPMTAEAKAAQSERAKKMWDARRAKKETPPDPALQEALAKAPFSNIEKKLIETVAQDEKALNAIVNAQLDSVTRIIDHVSTINVDVDWEKIAMPDAQQFYAQLKEEFEKAGRILNARSNARTEGYDCFMCKHHFNGRPGMTDLSYQDPKTGLFPRVDICGELCVINYHKMRIDMRVASNIVRGDQERA